jgi:hypothetical protein
VTITIKTIFITLLVAFLLFVLAMGLGMKGGKPKEDEEDF